MKLSLRAAYFGGSLFTYVEVLPFYKGLFVLLVTVLYESKNGMKNANSVNSRFMICIPIHYVTSFYFINSIVISPLLTSAIELQQKHFTYVMKWYAFIIMEVILTPQVIMGCDFFFGEKKLGVVLQSN